MTDRNLYRALLLAAALVTAVHAASSDAALPAAGEGDGAVHCAPK